MENELFELVCYKPKKDSFMIGVIGKMAFPCIDMRLKMLGRTLFMLVIDKHCIYNLGFGVKEPAKRFY